MLIGGPVATHDRDGLPRASPAAVPVNVEVRQGDVVETILQTAAEIDADLIAMPTAGHRGILDALRGSTTERVLRHAPCPARFWQRQPVDHGGVGKVVLNGRRVRHLVGLPAEKLKNIFCFQW